MKRILKSIVMLLGVLMLPVAAVAQNIHADVNGDLEVNIADVNAVIKVILGGPSIQTADVNGDDEINIADVNAIINFILNGGIDQHLLEVCERVSEIDHDIEFYYEECETLEELKEHAAEIEALEGVEYVFFDNNTTMYVKIKDFGTISYSYFPELEISDSTIIQYSKFEHSLQKAIVQTTHSHQDFGGVLIVNQQSKDENRMFYSKRYEKFLTFLLDCGFEQSRIEPSPDVEFFRNGIFENDYVFLITHGGYEFDKNEYDNDPNYQGLHWLLTSEELSHDSDGNILPTELANLRERYNESDVSIGTISEQRNGEKVRVKYKKVSDQFIASSDKSFPHPDKAIVFNTACHSMEGPCIIPDEDSPDEDSYKDSVDYTLSSAFCHNGAGIYLGYDETNSRGKLTGLQFYYNLLSGMSIQSACDNLQFDNLHEYLYNKDSESWYWADLIQHCPQQDFYNTCIIRPSIKFDDNSTESELSINLHANSYFRSYNLAYTSRFISDIFYLWSDVLSYGFELSESEQFTDALKLGEKQIGDENCHLEENNFLVDYSQSLTYSAGQTDAKIKPNTTYWARAYVYDGQGYNYSEPITFTTGSIAGENPQTETFTVNGVSFTMVTVDGGTFLMGDSEGIGSSKERPAHQVTLSTFSIGQTEVTQALWNAVMGINPSYFNSNFSNPVEQITWGDCQLFISELNKLTGRGFRLPTNAEWEFAARGGNHSLGFKYSGSNIADDVAWHEGNANNTTHVVANKAPNELGLYDMSGNVWEWCQDWFEDYSSNAQTNPTGPASGSYRVMRSGSYDFEDFYCRVAHRNRDTPERTSPHLGMRLALDDVFHLSDSIVKMHVDDEKIVYIFNGSGQYSVNGDSGIIDTFIQGNQLILKGKSKGIATLTISDDIKKVTKYLKVYVDTYEWVDLGLPSGTLWAMYNVGANSPEEYGDYFAWGETTPKEVYSWRTYKWSNGDFDELTKYCNDSYYGYNGFTDGKMKLDLEDDAAYVNWGPEWRIPTLVQMYELCTKCSWRSSSLHGVYGVIVTGPNGNSLFLPAAGYRYYGSLEDVDEEGYYWSNQIVTNHPCDAAFFGNYYYDDFYDAEDRSIGFPVRAVRVP